jgi:thymidylate kinase
MGLALADRETRVAARCGELQLSHKVGARLEEAGIRYCHFKSNQHLAEALQGITDMDVLVDRHAGPRLAQILAELDCKRFSSSPGGDYPAVEDYLGFDVASGRLIHLHLHHRLTAGERYLKGYRLPWEELVLSTSRKDAASGFHTSDPNVECLLLLVRSALKIGATGRLLTWFGRDAVSADEAREFTWLRQRTDRERLVVLGESLLGRSVAPVLRQIVTDGPSVGRLLELRRRGRAALDLCRTFPLAEGILRRWWRMIVLTLCRVGKRLPNAPITVSRVNPRGGVLIAFLGADGSGKSSLAKRVVSWLRWKIDARAFYFGSGDGPSSLLRLPLRQVLRWVIARRSGGKKSNVTPLRDRVPTGVRALWALVLSLEKRHRLRQVWGARNRGLIVVCDRYPQNQIMGYSDGPLLHRWKDSRSPLLRMLSRWEAAPYSWAEAHPPDLVLKLHVTPEVARRRKPEMRLDELARRECAISDLRFSTVTRVRNLNADRGWDEVLLECKREVWEEL